MSQPDPEQSAGDPSMEDILASIRRILNDGESGLEGMEPAPVAPQARLDTSQPQARLDASQPQARLDASQPQALDASQPQARLDAAHETAPKDAASHSAPDAALPAHPEAGDDVFVLDQTMLIEEPTPMPTEHAAAHEPTHDQPEVHGGFGHAEAVPPPQEPLLAPTAAAATSASLGALVRVVSQRQTSVHRGGPTIEDIVREEIRPIVKGWLDEHLAPMVERMVRAEIERVTSGASF